jgi:hypothetical protein
MPGNIICSEADGVKFPPGVGIMLGLCMMEM